MDRSEAAVLDAHRAGSLALNFVAGMTRELFMNDLQCQSGVCYQLMVLGEAIKRVGDSIRQSHPEIPWRQAAGLRDVLIHQYDRVDLEELWKFLQEDIPRLVEQLACLIPEA